MKLFASLLTVLLLTGTHSYSQSVTNSIVNLSYGTLKTNTIELTFSAGDLFYGEINNGAMSVIGMLGSAGMSLPTGLESSLINDGFYIYPNPCAETLYYLSGTERNLTVTLYDMRGVSVKYLDLSGSREIDMSDIAEGSYVIHFRDMSTNEYYIDKLIKIQRP